ncbi:MAG: hypothetical protein Q9165_004490 [Trypethelium subeluteriae]
MVPSNRPERSGSFVRTEEYQTNAGEVDPDADVLNEVVMAVDVRDRGDVGCCYYVARDEKLYFMEDVKLGGVDVVDARICENARLSERTQYVQSLAKSAVLTPFVGDQFRLPYLFDIRPSGEFSYEGGKDKLLTLNLGTDGGPEVNFVVPGDVQASDRYLDREDDNWAGRQGRMLRLSAWIDVESPLTVCAMVEFEGY